MFPTHNDAQRLQASLGNDLLLFLPELALCVGIVALLLARLVPALDRVHLGGGAVVALVIALFAGGYQLADSVVPQLAPGLNTVSYFGGMLTADPWGGFVRMVVLAAALLTVLLTLLTGIPDRDDSADFYALLLGGTLGMSLMASASHLLIVFVAVEMASLPGYALAAFLKGKRTGSEAGLKYVVYGAAASGIMLYGITLLAGTFGSGTLSDVAAGIAQRGLDLPVLAGLTFTLVGLGFKLAAVPFQFWCPDVFEGAAAEVAGFLSVASKAGAIGLTGRLLFTLHEAHHGAWTIPASLGVGVAVVAMVTVTFGNLAAFAQTDLKRLLAYSTIAHAGYMLMALAVMTPASGAAVLYYLAGYVAMNLGAFAVVALVRNATGREDLGAFRGLVRRSPLLAVTMTLFLASLLGLPPLAGFAGKFQVFAAVYDAAKAASASGPPGLGTVFFVLLSVGALNTTASAYYYLKVARAMLLDEPETASGEPKASAGTALFLVALVAFLFAAGVVWEPMMALTVQAAGAFRSS